MAPRFTLNTTLTLLCSRLKTEIYREPNVCSLFEMHNGTLEHFDWPVKSPDLDCIEISCDYFEQQVKQQNRLCELYLNSSQSVEKWSKIDKKYLRTLVTSILDSIIAVIMARGGATMLFEKNFFVLEAYT